MEEENAVGFLKDNAIDEESKHKGGRVSFAEWSLKSRRISGAS